MNPLGIFIVTIASGCARLVMAHRGRLILARCVDDARVVLS